MKYIYMLIFMQLSLSLYAQVGVNTHYPLGIFHVDGAKDDTPTPTSNMTENDFLVNSDGKIGIGIITPQTSLHVNTALFRNGFRLADGTQGNGKLLKSLNVNGDVAWENRLSVKIVQQNGNYNGTVNSDMQYASRRISLEPGKWIIRTNLLLYTRKDGSINDGFYARFSWAEYNGTSYNITPDAIFGNSIGGAYIARYGLATGNTIIENTSSSAKMYYLVTRTPIFIGAYNPNTLWNNLGGGWAETSIIAFPAN
ncbi:hypothetical protein [Empedobacter brevis]|uniref:hypothetical protein n=1 Tax=Empedobacter brevis TaxID=247 RepID=UPI00333E250C